MSEANSNSSPSPDIISLLSKLASNPETLSKINGIISKHAKEQSDTNPPPNNDLNGNSSINNTESADKTNDIDDSSTTSQINKSDENSFDFTKIISILGEKFASQKHHGKEQTNLLLAIRPYLSPRRQELIDSFIKLTQMSEIFKKFSQNGGTDVLQ